MIGFYYGSDGYRARQALERFIARQRETFGRRLQVTALDMESPGGAEQLDAHLRTPSFFDEITLVVLQNACADGAVSSHIARMVAAQDAANDRRIIVGAAVPLTAKELASKHKALWEAMTGPGAEHEASEPLAGATLARWIREECTARGCDLEPQAQMLLAERTGGETWRLALELDKLANYCRSGTISRGDVERLVPASDVLNIFDCIDALGSGDKARALTVLYRELASGRDPYYILTMVIYQFRNLLAVKDAASRTPAPAAVAAATGLHPFVARKAMDQSRRFSMDQLRAIFRCLADLDIRIKQGIADAKDELYAFTATLP